MVILIDGTPAAQPTDLRYEWLTVSGALVRQFTLKYDYLSQGDAETLFSRACKPDGCALSLVDPATGQNQSLSVKAVEAVLPVLNEIAGSLSYAGASLVLREAPTIP
ncbi:MAG: hypothetical protein GX171_05865 [Clostridiales bacterium]|jgi:hypothetical protein|nr:hypothetical protein [Clostridiales bacterium]